MTIILWIFFSLLFIWVVVLQTKTSDMNNRIDSLSRKLKRLESHLKTPSAENKPALYTQETFEETENADEYTEEECIEEGYIDDVGITENTPVAEEENAAVKSYSYNYESNEQNNDFEHVFLGKISYVIGAIAIIIGFAIFIGIIQGALSPLVKAILALCTGTGIIICGLCIKKESLLKYSEALIGTGFAVIFITIYCATMIVHTFSNLTCTVLGIITLIAAYLVANKQKTLSMIAIALIGGYFNVFMVSKNVTLDNLFIYFIFLNVLSMAFVIKNTDKHIINYINIILTGLFSVSFIYGSGSKLSFVYPVILWAVYQVYDVLMREKYEAYDKEKFFHWLNYAILTVISVAVFKTKMQIGTVQMYLAIPYCILACIYIAKNSERYLLYLNNLLLCILAAVVLMTDGCLRVGLLSMGAIILAIIINKADREYLVRWSTGFISAGVITAFLFNRDMIYVFDAANYHPVFNLRTLALVSTILASFVCYTEFKEAKSELCHRMSHYMKFCAITLLYILVSFEIGDYIQYIAKEKASAVFISAMTYSIICSIYSLQMKKLNTITKLPIFNAAFYAVGIIALLILFFEGLTFKPVESFIPIFNLRFIAFMAATAVTAYIAKSEKSDFYKYLALILGFVLLSAETNDYTRNIAAGGMGYLMSVIWTLYAGVLLAIGIFKDKKYLKMTGIWIIIITVLKILFVDMAQVNFLYKMIVFVLLGAVLMLVSYYYNKKQK